MSNQTNELHVTPLPLPLMTIKDCCYKNKVMLIALYILVRECAARLQLRLDGSLSEICRLEGVNRTQVYEKKAQLMELFAKIELPGRGRPAGVKELPVTAGALAGRELREQVLRYRLEHPAAMVRYAGGNLRYSDGFKRFILDLGDPWESDLESFCRWVEVPYSTLREWQRRDRKQAYRAMSPRVLPVLSRSASADTWQIVQDYGLWEGRLRDFLGYEAKRLWISPSAIRRVLVITGMLVVKSCKPPRYRGSTERCAPGEILVTDGKQLEVLSTASGEIIHYNWQAMVDQATACHTAAVVSDTECAEGVREAFVENCRLLGRTPEGLVHDNKPIHTEAVLKEAVEPDTRMIPASLNRPENKAVVEGEFGKWEQAVGSLRLDDSSLENLRRSAVSEAVRVYVAGINHAGRAEFKGQSRLRVLRKACPDPTKNQAFIEQLHGEHKDQGNQSECLPSQRVARQILDAGFVRFGLEGKDPKGKLRTWLSGRFTPEAIRQGLAIFGTEQAKGRLRGKIAHRYLVKLIRSAQDELDLRTQEQWLREYAEIERRAWLVELEQDYSILKTECAPGIELENNLAFRLSEKAVFGGLPLARTFWEEKLKGLLAKQHQLFEAVCRHVRRLFEAPWNDRFHLVSRLIDWECQLA